MTPLGFVLASLRHYRRIQLAVALGVAVATAVLTGALLVGDSVRGSLRDLTLQRLGRIDSALVAGTMFRAALADELAADANLQRHFSAAEPALLVPGTLQTGSGGELRRATAIFVIGSRPAFWSLGQGGPEKEIADDEILLTEPLAHELNVAVGDRVLLRIPTAGSIPTDSPLGEKSDTSKARQFTLATILPAAGLSRFSLAPTQHLPRNAFVSLAALQELLEEHGKANAILVATNVPNRGANDEARGALDEALRPRLEDYGLRVEEVAAPRAYVQISADQLVLPDEVVRAAEKAFPAGNLQPVVTYLANTLVVGADGTERKIPYSTIVGVDSTATLGPLVDGAGQPIRLADDEIALNRWAADDLRAKLGDVVAVSFYEPESTHGVLHERAPPPTFKLRAIVELETPDGAPTPAADPKLTPELPGVTDQQSINDWELPFELTETIRRQDEDYWDAHRTTPKAFVSLAAAKSLWKSRWGTISLLRLPASEPGPNASPTEEVSQVNVSDRLLREIDPTALGMTFIAVKQLGLAAASGTTPFDLLFLGFSFFLIAAAVMLIVLLFQLGADQRARELGTLAAAGLGRRRIARLLGREALAVAIAGATVGVTAGILYAWLMITGLRTWWVSAVGTPFLQLHVAPLSLVVGWVAGVIVSWLAIRWSIRRMVREPVNRLLAGSLDNELTSSESRRSRPMIWPWLRAVLIIFVIALVAAGFKLQGEAQALVFFGSGAAVLWLALGELRNRLRGDRRRERERNGLNLAELSALNTARNPRRSILTIGLVAAATFLIVAISAFRLESGDAGTGGFALLATSDQPIVYDVNTPAGRVDLGFTDEANQQLNNWSIYSLRVAAGEDASCLNLYRPTQPRVLGASEALIERGGFAWAATADLAGRSADNPWTLLQSKLGNDGAGQPIVPVALDASTAIYSLHLAGVGSRLEIRDAFDRPVTLQVVGLLKNSVLQGSLLIGESDFLRLFPDTGGYRFFLIEQSSGHGPRADAAFEVEAKPNRIGDSLRAPEADRTRSVPATLNKSQVTQLLESTLADDGFDVTEAKEQLAQFLAVQNTYLSTFQSLGGLGLLLGTFGLAIVQLRSVLERRGELALMRAAGFPRGRLVRMVVCENAVLLLGGLAIGCVAAAVALLPQWAPQQASVPWNALAALLGAVAIVGLGAGWLATRSALRAPLLPALRGE